MDDLVNLIAQRYIQRRDVKAVQFRHGGYSPDYRLKNRHGQVDPGRHGPLGWKRQHIQAHLNGDATYGHYVLDKDSLCRVITFDIDLIDEEFGGSYYIFDDDKVIERVNPRVLWRDREFVNARRWLKYQMHTLAHKFCDAVMKIGLQTAAAYSGNKGIHVYGFLPKPVSASAAHQGAMMVFETLDEFDQLNASFFRHRNPDPVQGYQNFSVEIYPKQESLEGKQLGNLVRLPLGRNLKGNDPTFFLNLTCPMAEFKPHSNPVRLLTEGNPFS